METFSSFLAICERNSPVTCEFPAERSVPRSFDVFFDLRLNEDWVNNREAGYLRRHRAHYDVTVMKVMLTCANTGLNVVMTSHVNVPLHGHMCFLQFLASNCFISSPCICMYMCKCICASAYACAYVYVYPCVNINGGLSTTDEVWYWRMITSHRKTNMGYTSVAICHAQRDCFNKRLLRCCLITSILIMIATNIYSSPPIPQNICFFKLLISNTLFLRTASMNYHHKHIVNKYGINANLTS